MDVTGCGNRSKPAADNRKRRIGLLGNYGIPGGYLECQATAGLRKHDIDAFPDLTYLMSEGEEEVEPSFLPVNETQNRGGGGGTTFTKLEEWSEERSRWKSELECKPDPCEIRGPTAVPPTPHHGWPHLPADSRAWGPARPSQSATFLDRWGVAAFSPPRSSFHAWISIVLSPSLSLSLTRRF